MTLSPFLCSSHCLFNIFPVTPFQSSYQSIKAQFLVFLHRLLLLRTDSGVEEVGVRGQKGGQLQEWLLDCF